MFVGNLSEALRQNLQEHDGAEALGVDPNSITPSFVNELSEALHDTVAIIYNDAFVPVFFVMVPLIAFALVLMFFLKETRLAETIEESGFTS